MRKKGSYFAWGSSLTKKGFFDPESDGPLPEF